LSKVWELLGRGDARSSNETPPPAPPDDKQPDVIEGVLDTYRVPENGNPASSAEVFISGRGGIARYLVRPPSLDDQERALLERLKASLMDSIPLEEGGEPKEVLDHYLWKGVEETGAVMSRDLHDRLLYYLVRDFVGFWEVDTLVNDDKLEEISVTRWDRPVRVMHRNFGEFMFMETNISYPSEDRLQAFVRRLAQLGGTTVSLAHPSLEVTLHGASDRRVTATLGDEISRPGTTFAIRKQRARPITLVQLASTERTGWPRPAGPAEAGDGCGYDEVHSHKTLSVLMAAYFWLLLERTANVLIAGETNSGKTTLMNAVLALANPNCKVVTAEDVLEISLPDNLHWQRLKTRPLKGGPTPTSGKYGYELPDLLKLALRFSPTILSLGEMRGEESETLAAAITLGFSTMTTIHAEDAERCIQRLTTPPMKFQAGHIRDITAIATVRKVTLPDASVARRVVSVDELKPEGSASYKLVNVFRYQHKTDSFFPTTPAEVIDRSYRLGEIAAGIGWTPGEVQRNLAMKVERIGGMVDQERLDPESLSRMVSEFAAEERGEDGDERGPGRPLTRTWSRGV